MSNNGVFEKLETRMHSSRGGACPVGGGCACRGACVSGGARVLSEGAGAQGGGGVCMPGGRQM